MTSLGEGVLETYLDSTLVFPREICEICATPCINTISVCRGCPALPLQSALAHTASPSDQAGLQDLIYKAQSTIAALGETMQLLLSTHQALSSWVSEQKSRMRVTALHKLPTEVLQIIFTLAAPQNNMSTKGIMPSMTFTQICRHWRSIAFGTPGLWTNLQFILHPGYKSPEVVLRRMNFYFTYSANARLSLSFAELGRQNGLTALAPGSNHPPFSEIGHRLGREHTRWDHLSPLSLAPRLRHLKLSRDWGLAMREIQTVIPWGQLLSFSGPFDFSVLNRVRVGEWEMMEHLTLFISRSCFPRFDSLPPPISAPRLKVLGLALFDLPSEDRHTVDVNRKDIFSLIQCGPASLEELTLINFTVSWKDCNKLTDFLQENHRALRYLDLIHAYIKNLPQVLDAVPFLETLYLNSGLVDSRIASWLKRLPRLEALAIAAPPHYVLGRLKHTGWLHFIRDNRGSLDVRFILEPDAETTPMEEFEARRVLEEAGVRVTRGKARTIQGF
ncbi:hypothetical protein DL96DRAFT_1582905 [Flagelloscypha sp. PMI_526]|nr:hypothetical protein DL96DRAFT_1582905 [Flagelloscypha sp. PMI_526]